MALFYLVSTLDVFHSTKLRPRHEVGIILLSDVLLLMVTLPAAILVANTKITLDCSSNDTFLDTGCEDQWKSVIKSPGFFAILISLIITIIGIMWAIWILTSTRTTRAFDYINTVNKMNAIPSPSDIIDPNSTRDEVKRVRKKLLLRDPHLLSPILQYTVRNILTLSTLTAIVGYITWLLDTQFENFICDNSNHSYECYPANISVPQNFCIVYLVLLAVLAMVYCGSIYICWSLIKESFCGKRMPEATEMFKQNVQDNKFVELFAKHASAKRLSYQTIELLSFDWYKEIQKVLKEVVLKDCDKDFKELIKELLGREVGQCGSETNELLSEGSVSSDGEDYKSMSSGSVSDLSFKSAHSYG